MQKLFKPLGIFLFGLLLILLISGCATLNKDECRNADWNLIGFEDAARGYALERIGQHRKACAKTNVVPDMNAYETGHKKGVRQYCTLERGYREGLNGATYRGICPADLSRDFLRAYYDGQALYTLKQTINSTTSALKNYREQIARKEENINSHETAIVDASSSSLSRKENLAAIKTLQQEITSLEVNSAAAAEELMMLQDNYDALARQHREWGY
jgi:hypothetical protein